MGFAVMPEPPNPGVYVFKPTGDLVVITEAHFFFGLQIIYKPWMRPKRVSYRILKQLVYIGEF